MRINKLRAMRRDRVHRRRIPPVIFTFTEKANPSVRGFLDSWIKNIAGNDKVAVYDSTGKDVTALLTNEPSSHPECRGRWYPTEVYENKPLGEGSVFDMRFEFSTGDQNHAIEQGPQGATSSESPRELEGSRGDQPEDPALPRAVGEKAPSLPSGGIPCA
jgi:hypothetical protein